MLSQDETTALLDPTCLFLAHSPSIHTMSTRVYLVKIVFKFVDLPDKNTLSEQSTPVKGYKEYPKGPLPVGMGGILNTDTCY